MTDATTIGWLVPELVLVVAATLVFVVGAFIPSRGGWTLFALISLGVSCFFVYGQQSLLGGTVSLSGPLILDGLAGVGRLLAVVLGLFFVIVLGARANSELATETLGMVLLAIAGLMLSIWAGDLALLFLGLELISIPTYAVLFTARRDRMAAESAVKYFLLSIVSSAMMLYGMSLIYGVTGTLRLPGIAESLATGAVAAAPGTSLSSLLPLATILVFAGLGFKIAAVPFHFYAPDVYQATTNGNAGLLAVIPKVAGVIAIIRILGAIVPAALPVAWQIAVVLAVITMTLGNVCALWQKNVRRMMAYSSIAHAGYMLIGLAVGFSSVGVAAAPVYSGISATLLYLMVYSFASLGTFAVLAHLSSDSKQLDTVDELSGLARRCPGAAAAMAVCMFSLTGIPPLAGFWGKMTLFSGALSAASYGGGWFLALAVVGGLNAAIGAAYYLRIVGAMYFQEPRSEPQMAGWSSSLVVAVLCATIVLVSGVMPGAVVRSFGRITTGVAVPTSAARELPMERFSSTHGSTTHGSTTLQ